jgi:two-component system, NtrC family, response regulator HydG
MSGTSDPLPPLSRPAGPGFVRPVRPSSPLHPVDAPFAAEAFEGWLENHFIGRHPLVLAARSAVAMAALHDWPVLIAGETGTGKDMLAGAIHAGSARNAKPAQVLAVSGLGETAWSMLFGHQKGAFTGADASHEGVFRAADASTLILEDVADLPLKVQPMLLRAVEHGRFRPLGSERELRVDVRVISTSNVPLTSEIERGRFRADLYQRLSLFRVHLPALRDHLSDLDLLVPHFMAKHAPKSVGPDGLEELRSYEWPRNVRQLEHVLLRAAWESEGAVVGARDIRRILLDDPTPLASARGAGRPAIEVDRAALIRALRAAGGNKREAARRLNMAAGTLYRLLRSHQIRPKDLMGNPNV